MSQVNMSFAKLKTFTTINSITEGIYRGLAQVPLILGACAHLQHLGLSASDSLSYTFLYLFSLPKFFSLIFEIIGGLISYKLGPRGSFSSIFIGKFLRGLALLLIALSFLNTNTSFFIFLSCTGVIIGEFGRCLVSGSFEDAFERTLNKIELGSYHIQMVEVSNMLVLRLFQIPTALFATILVGLMAKYDRPSFVTIFFLACSCVQFFSMFKFLEWYKWSKSFFSNKEEKFPLVVPQLIHFLKSPGLIFIISTGSMGFLFIKTSSLAILTSTNFLSNLEKNNLLWQDIIITSLCSILVPLGSIAGIELFLKKNGQELLEKYCYKLGTIHSIIWITIATLSYFMHPLTLVQNIFFALLLCILYSPIYSWHNWLRIKITESAIKNGAPIGENKSLYYSIIEGGKEMIIGLLPLAFFSHSYINAQIAILSLFSVLLFTLWINYSKKPIIKN